MKQSYPGLQGQRTREKKCILGETLEASNALKRPAAEQQPIVLVANQLLVIRQLQT